MVLTSIGKMVIKPKYLKCMNVPTHSSTVGAQMWPRDQRELLVGWHFQVEFRHEQQSVR